jgi:hypothetical protein
LRKVSGQGETVNKAKGDSMAKVKAIREFPRYLCIASKAAPGYGAGDAGVFHITAELVTRRDDCEGPYGTGDKSVRGLMINSQGSNGDGAARHLYGWAVRFMHLYSIELEDAERILVTLKTVRRYLDKAYAKSGNPSTFADYVLRVGAALDVDGYVIETPHGWRWMDAADAHSHIAHLDRTWQRAGLAEAV